MGVESVEVVLFGIDGFRSMDPVRSTVRWCSATKASAPSEVVGDKAPDGSLVGSSEVKSKARERLSDAHERLFVVKMLCPGWLLLAVDMDENREWVVDCKEVVEERLLRLEKDL